MRVLPFALILLLPVPSVASAQSHCTSAPTTARALKVEAANKRAVLRFHDALNRQDWRTMDSMIAPGYRHFVPSADGFRALDWATFKRGNAHIRAAFPDWKNRILLSVAEGDKVAVLIQGQGTHQGSIEGEKATGRTAKLPIMIIHQLCAGKLISDWEMVDVGPMMSSLKGP